MSTLDETTRRTEAEVDPIFTERWSPRAFAERTVSDDDLASVFEAARWAPSCFNAQPWLFVHGRSPEDHGRFLATLVEGNRTWAERAPVLGFVFARRTFERNGKPNRWGGFDSGAASMSLALQANRLGLATHFMGGFDVDAAHAATGVSADDYEAMAAFALGYPDAPSILPPELQEREVPSGRKPLAEVAHEGRVPGGA